LIKQGFHCIHKFQDEIASVTYHLLPFSIVNIKKYLNIFHRLFFHIWNKQSLEKNSDSQLKSFYQCRDLTLLVIVLWKSNLTWHFNELLFLKCNQIWIDNKKYLCVLHNACNSIYYNTQFMQFPKYSCQDLNK
jgi:hypothetical protein